MMKTFKVRACGNSAQDAFDRACLEDGCDGINSGIRTKETIKESMYHSEEAIEAALDVAMTSDPPHIISNKVFYLDLRGGEYLFYGVIP